MVSIRGLVVICVRMTTIVIAVLFRGVSLLLLEELSKGNLISLRAGACGRGT